MKVQTIKNIASIWNDVWSNNLTNDSRPIVSGIFKIYYSFIILDKRP
jgi:hypothetical protein